MSEIVKLKALSANLSYCLSGTISHFDPRDVGDLFLRYKALSDSLRSSNPEWFADLPFREFKSSETADYGGRGYYKRIQLEVLKMDIDYCINILQGMSTVSVPSMKITREGIFFSGQFFDAIQQVSEILSNAKRSIILIDGYVDQKVLDIATVKKPDVHFKILTKDVTPAFKRAGLSFNKQYGGLSIRKSSLFHDRFIIIDEEDFYHFGASIKDLGKRGFMFSRIEEPEVINRLLSSFEDEWSKAEVEL